MAHSIVHEEFDRTYAFMDFENESNSITQAFLIYFDSLEILSSLKLFLDSIFVSQ